MSPLDCPITKKTAKQRLNKRSQNKYTGSEKNSLLTSSGIKPSRSFATRKWGLENKASALARSPERVSKAFTIVSKGNLSYERWLKLDRHENNSDAVYIASSLTSWSFFFFFGFTN